MRDVGIRRVDRSYQRIVTAVTPTKWRPLSLPLSTRREAPATAARGPDRPALRYAGAGAATV